MPPGWNLGDDPWDRYRAADLDPDGFVVPAERLLGPDAGGSARA